MKNSPLFGHLLALITILIWGVTYSSTKILLEALSPLQIIFTRFIIAYLLLWIVHPHRLRVPWKQEVLFALSGLTGVTLYFLCENIAIDYTSASLVGILVAVAPFLTGIFAWIFFKRPVRKTFVIGFVLAFLGVCAITMTGSMDFGFSLVGLVLALIAPIAWALYCIVVEPVTAHHYPALAQTRRIFFWGVIFLIPAFFVLREPFVLSPFLKLRYTGHLLFLALGGSTLGYILWNKALSILGSVKTSAYVYLSPVASLFFGVLLLSESVTLLEVAGIVLILVGLILSELQPKKSSCS